MSKRSADSDIISKFTAIYKDMPKHELRQEFNALADQILAFLLATNCASIEVFYDATHILKCEFSEVAFKPKRTKDYKQSMM